MHDRVQTRNIQKRIRPLWMISHRGAKRRRRIKQKAEPCQKPVPDHFGKGGEAEIWKIRKMCEQNEEKRE